MRRRSSKRWYVGQEGGTAVGEVLFGDVNPGGKLPVSVPRSSGSCRSTTTASQPRSVRTSTSTREPLWPFGYGLSYTTFTISDPIVDACVDQTRRSDDRARRGHQHRKPRRATRSSQLYIRDLVSSVTRPVLELRRLRARHTPAGRAEDRVLHRRTGGLVAHRSRRCAGWSSPDASTSWSAPARPAGGDAAAGRRKVSRFRVSEGSY